MGCIIFVSLILPPSSGPTQSLDISAELASTLALECFYWIIKVIKINSIVPSQFFHGFNIPCSEESKLIIVVIRTLYLNRDLNQI
nr:hypothetical protein Iba_chr12aCG17330 [Ipomoea batatas]